MSEEQQYISLLHEITNFGSKRDDRTGTGVYSLFGKQLKFSLTGNVLPLLTTKRVFLRGVVIELLWILSGNTCVKDMSKNGVRIWDGNTTDPSYIKRTGNEPMDIGPGYGFQLRHFGGNYKGGGLGQDIRGAGGIDQLKLVITEIMTNPTSRRIMWNYWNPSQQEQMCLPPCHFCYQFYVDDGKLSCMMTQRSADVFLGLPFNIASVSLLVFILAKVCGLDAGGVIISIGDAHLYSNHIEQSKKQMDRDPFEFPTFEFVNVDEPPSDVDGKIRWITSLTFANFNVQNYKCHPTIKAPMAV